MKKRTVPVMLLVAAVTLCACKKEGGGKPDLKPAVTPVGTNDGTAITQTIGSAGGTIVSDDGELELIIPSGALTANTDITVQPITNNAPNGRRKAYRCTPDGLTFSKNITIRFHYTDEDAAATMPEYMQVAFQTADGNWQLIDDATNDETAKTISVSVNHFTDFSSFDIMRIQPAVLYLRKQQTGQYQVTFTGLTQLQGVAYLSQVLENPEVWKVNGVTGGNSTYGTIAANADQVNATYTAPANEPPANPVDITAEINFPFTVDGQQFNKGIVTAKAYIIGNRYQVDLEFKGEMGSGTGERFRVQDNVRMTVNLTGAEGTVTGAINVQPSFDLISPSTNGCTTSFVSNGTGPINLRDIDVIGVTRNDITGDVYVYFQADVGAVPAVMQITCQSNSRTENWLPWNTGGAILTFKDNGQPQRIDMSHVSSQGLELIVTPLQ